MKFDGVELGGREIGPVSIRTEGDTDLAMQYIDYGRKCLGELKRQIQLSPMTYKVGQATWKIQGDPEVSITVKSNMIGLADIDEMLIAVGKPKKLTGKDKIIGFVAHLKEAATSSFGIFVKSKHDFDEEFLFVGSGTYKSVVIARDKLTLVPGEIEGTFDESQILPNNNLTGRGRYFYYWDGTYQGSAVGDWGPVELGFIPQPINPPYTDIPFYKVDQPPNGTNIALAATCGIMPVESIRNRHKHIVMNANPQHVARSVITCEDTDNDAFIAVIPGDSTYNFDDPTFNEEKYGFTSAYDYSYKYDILAGDIPTLGIVGFPGAPTNRNSTVIGTHHVSQTVTPKNLDVTAAKVDDGQYYIVGQGAFDIYLLCESGAVYKKSHEFLDAMTEVFIINVGMEFKDNDFNSAIKVIDKVTDFGRGGPELTLVIDLSS